MPRGRVHWKAGQGFVLETTLSLILWAARAQDYGREIEFAARHLK